MKQKNLRLENMPTEVFWVMSLEGSMVGTKTFDKIHSIIEKYPEWFPWENEYSKIPQEVHDAFRKEAYPKQPNFDEMINDVDNKPRKTFLQQINEAPTITYKELSTEEILSAFQQMIENSERQERERHIEQERVERIWNKHYKKYKLPYRP